MRLSLTRIRRTRTWSLAACLCLLSGVACAQQEPADSAHDTAPQQRPLPDIDILMHQVEANQRRSETIEKEYIYHGVETQKELDSHGQVKKTVVNEYDHFWTAGVPVRRMVKKNGRELTPDEVARENEHIDKEAAKAKDRRDKADSSGKQTDADGHDEITVSRLLELGSFTNPRRVQRNGRDTIVVDYTGDPKAKTRNRGEEVIRDMAGTAWVDEQDHVLARAEGRFLRDFKIGGGLIVDVKKETRFAINFIKVNGEVWLPAHIDAQGAIRALLFVNLNGSVDIEESEYRKFRATSTILPGTMPVTGDPSAEKPEH